MDKQLKRWAAAEKLRRRSATRRRDAELWDAYRRGECSVPRAPLVPPDFLREVLHQMAQEFAREAMRKSADQLPYPIVGQVATKVWDYLRVNGSSLEREVEGRVRQDMERDSLVLSVKLPAMELRHETFRADLARFYR